MKGIELEHQVEMLLALLRAALHQSEVQTSFFKHSTAGEWKLCYRLAVKQGVAALAWSAVERLPKELCPPLDVKLSWALCGDRQLEKYSNHCRVAHDLAGLYARNGIATVVLKGVGLSRLYPVPALREVGDIDIYTCSADKSRMTDDEANALANELMEQRGAGVDYSYKRVHSSFFYKGVRFENHSRFLNPETSAQVDGVDEWLKEQLFPRAVKLLDGECDVNVPSDAFDAVFIPLHAAHHYGKGLSLRHLCDWSVLAMQDGFELPRELDDKCYRRVTRTLSQLCNRYLGASIPVEGYGKLADEMMREIICPPFSGKARFNNPVKACWYKVRLKLHLLGLRHSLLGISLWKGVARLCKSVLSKPSRLYK